MTTERFNEVVKEQLERIEKLLVKNNITKSKLGNILGISSRTIAKIGKGEKISRLVIEKICNYHLLEMVLI